MFAEPEKARKLRALIHTAETNPNFIAEGMEALGLGPEESFQPLTLFHHDWGSLSDGLVGDKEALIWTRTDQGPAVADTGTYSIETKIMRFALMARLTVVLREAGIVTFASTGIPIANWRHCQIYLDGERLSGVIWADAITGTCSVYNKREKASEPGTVPSTVRSGNVAIVIGEKDLGFF